MSRYSCRVLPSFSDVSWFISAEWHSFRSITWSSSFSECDLPAKPEVGCTWVSSFAVQFPHDL